MRNICVRRAHRTTHAGKTTSIREMFELFRRQIRERLSISCLKSAVLLFKRETVYQTERGPREENVSLYSSRHVRGFNHANDAFSMGVCRARARTEVAVVTQDEINLSESNWMCPMKVARADRGMLLPREAS